MNVSGWNSKEIFELFTNTLVFSVSKMKILTRHLLIGYAARNKCIFMDYDEEFFSYLSGMYSLTFGSFFWSAPVQDKTAESAPCVFSLFYKSTTICWYCECTQIKVDPLQFGMMYYSYLLWAKCAAYFKLFQLKKMQVIELAPPYLVLPLSAQMIGYLHIYVVLTCYMLKLF